MDDQVKRNFFCLVIKNCFHRLSLP